MLPSGRWAFKPFHGLDAIVSSHHVRARRRKSLLPRWKLNRCQIMP